VLPKYTEHFSRMTVIWQWVPDWRSTDAEGFSRQWKCHPRYRQ